MDRHAEGPLDALWSAVAAGAGPAALTTPISSGRPHFCTLHSLHPPRMDTLVWYACMWVKGWCSDALPHACTLHAACTCCLHMLCGCNQLPAACQLLHIVYVKYGMIRQSLDWPAEPCNVGTLPSSSQSLLHPLCPSTLLATTSWEHTPSVRSQHQQPPSPTLLAHDKSNDEHRCTSHESSKWCAKSKPRASTFHVCSRKQCCRSLDAVQMGRGALAQQDACIC